MTGQRISRACSISGAGPTTFALSDRQERADGRTARCLIRPESIELERGDGDHAVRAEIVHMTFLGEHVQYTARTEDGLDLRVTAWDTRTPHRPGDRVGVRVDPSRIVVLADDSS